MKKYRIEIIIHEQGKPERRVTAVLDYIPEDKLMAAAQDLPLSLLVRSLIEEDGRYQPT